MHSRPSRPAREGGLLRLLLIAASLATTLAPLGTALAQGAPPPKVPDMELDLDAPPPPEKKEEPPPLPPVEEGAWGVGGKDEEGKFVPGKTNKGVDEQEDTTPRPFEPPGAAGIDMLVGFGSMRDLTNDSNVTKLTVLSLVFGARYRFGESLTIGARFPYSTGSLDGPGGPSQHFNTFAVGNLELSGRYAIDLTPRLRLPIEAALYFPTASGDLFGGPADPAGRAQALINQAASYSRGFEENPLFASKRFGFRVGAGINYDKKAIHVEGHMRFDIMGKTGGNPTVTTADGAAAVHSPNTTWLTGGSFFHDFLDGKLSPGLRAWLAVTTLPVFAPSKDYSGAQFVIEPRVNGRLPLNPKGTLAVRGGLGYVIPLGGALGGGQKIGAQNSGSTGGLRVHAEFQF